MTRADLRILIAAAILLPGCMISRQLNRVTHMLHWKSDNHHHDVKRDTIIVWVHGTRLFGSQLIQQISYRKLGMHHMDTIKLKYQISKNALTLCQHGPHRFSHHNFYQFGWSGDISCQSRKQAAQDLYHAINSLKKNFQEAHACTPKLCIITHSHGGNVALNLAAVELEQHNDLVVDELILLACPVQEETSYLTASPIFKKIYSLFSQTDILQVIDPQGLYHPFTPWNENPALRKKQKPFFSGRTFEPLPKLLQAQISMHGRSLFHLDFILTSFQKRLPYLLDSLDTVAQEQTTTSTLYHLKI